MVCVAWPVVRGELMSEVWAPSPKWNVFFFALLLCFLVYLHNLIIISVFPFLVCMCLCDRSSRHTYSHNDSRSYVNIHIRMCTRSALTIIVIIYTALSHILTLREMRETHFSSLVIAFDSESFRSRVDVLWVYVFLIRIFSLSYIP